MRAPSSNVTWEGSAPRTWALAAVALLLCSGCGQVDRTWAYATGKPQEVCVDGVAYLQFSSGASVKYLPDGKVASCPK